MSAHTHIIKNAHICVDATGKLIGRSICGLTHPSRHASTPPHQLNRRQRCLKQPARPIHPPPDVRRRSGRSRDCVVRQATFPRNPNLYGASTQRREGGLDCGGCGEGLKVKENKKKRLEDRHISVCRSIDQSRPSRSFCFLSLPLRASFPRLVCFVLFTYTTCCPSALPSLLPSCRSRAPASKSYNTHSRHTKFCSFVLLDFPSLHPHPPYLKCATVPRPRPSSSKSSSSSSRPSKSSSSSSAMLNWEEMENSMPSSPAAACSEVGSCLAWVFRWLGLGLEWYGWGGVGMELLGLGWWSLEWYVWLGLCGYVWKGVW